MLCRGLLLKQYMKCLEVNFGQCTHCLQNLGITCIAYSFSPLPEMPDIFFDISGNALLHGLPVTYISWSFSSSESKPTVVIFLGKQTFCTQEDLKNTWLFFTNEVGLFSYGIWQKLRDEKWIVWWNRNKVDSVINLNRIKRLIPSYCLTITDGDTETSTRYSENRFRKLCDTLGCIGENRNRSTLL